jgi:hypothetical protein
MAIFDSHQVEYVVVGGYAANIHGSTRVTTDIDVTPNRGSGLTCGSSSPTRFRQ